MNNVNFLKPNKENLNLFLLLGSLFFVLGIFDFILNNFYEKNITSFLPRFISFFTPLIFGMIVRSLMTDFIVSKIVLELLKHTVTIEIFIDYFFYLHYLVNLWSTL